MEESGSGGAGGAGPRLQVAAAATPKTLGMHAKWLGAGGLGQGWELQMLSRVPWAPRRGFLFPPTAHDRGSGGCPGLPVPECEGWASWERDGAPTFGPPWCPHVACAPRRGRPDRDTCVQSVFFSQGSVSFRSSISGLVHVLSVPRGSVGHVT